MLLREFVELAAGLCQFARRDRKPRDERNAVLLAVVKHILMLAVADVVLVLHARDLHGLTRLFDLMRLHFAQADVLDLALLLELLDRAK